MINPIRFRRIGAALAIAALSAASGLAVPASAQKAAKPTAPPPLVKKPITGPTLYMVGYSHLDTEWRWSYPQVIREFIPNTLHENFTLFGKYPDYTFNWTGSNRYKYMKEYYPEDYAKLKTYIAGGRWFPDGSSIEEGDVDIPSEESIIRQVMYGNQFFRREFGIASDDFILPDCFGFPASLPSILAHCGIKGFSTQKLTWGSAVGIPFNVGKWYGPDGQYTVSALNAGSYTSDIHDDLSHDPEMIKRLAEDQQKTGVPVDYRYYGVGDRGGAVRDSDAKNLEISLHGDGPLKIVDGRGDQMFNDLSSAQITQLPSYTGDLLLTQHSTGSLSSESAMKRWNRENELLADDTERASIAADWLGAAPYDRDRITNAWLQFLPGQFHDLMAGTALPVAYHYAWNDQIIAQNEFAGVLTQSVGAVARGLDTQAKGVAVVIYNPLSIARQDVATATVTFPGAAPSAVQVFGPDGKVVPSQVIKRNGASVSLLFLAQAPSVGFATYDIRAAKLANPAASPLHVTTISLENARYRVKLDANGDVSSIYDKAAQREMLSAPARLAYMHENPSQYPAWNMDWDDQSKPPSAYVTGPATVKIVERGPVRVAVQVTREHGGSKFVQTISLAAGNAGSQVRFATQIDWQGKESALKAVFPLTVSNPKATYNWGLGTIQRGNNDPKKYEVPSHEWFDLTDTNGKYGVSVLDNCKYGSDKPADNIVRLTLLYTPGTRGGYQDQGTQDWGRSEMTYALVGHSGDWRQGKSQWQGARLNEPLLAFQTPSHPGKLGREFSMAQVSTPQVSIEALKKAEDGNEIIVRLNELAGKNAPNTLVSFAAPILSAREVNGQEQPLGPATVQGGKLVVNMTAYRPRAFAITLAKPHAALVAPTSRPLALPYNLDAVSSWAKKTDGNFDGAGKSLPGELLPATVVSNGVAFKMGPIADGQKNAVICQGQTIALPANSHGRVYLLAAAVGGDTPATFRVGSRPTTLTIQRWDGFIGQWDYRLWAGKVPELTYDWHNALAGLVPGYIKRAPVAWYADHRRLADGTNDIYQFCYLFRYALPIPAGAKTFTLPNNDKIRVMAITVADNPSDDTRPAQPLYDTLDRSAIAGPEIVPATGSFDDATEVAISHPLYWSSSDNIRYTLDGSAPTAQSAVYTGPVLLTKDAVLRAAQFDAQGRPGATSTAHFTVHDTTPPKVESALASTFDPVIRIKFSEPVDKASAEDIAHYSLAPAATIQSAALDADGRAVTLTLSAPLTSAATLTINGVHDLSPAANAVSQEAIPVTQVKPVFQQSDVQTFDGTGRGFVQQHIANLPTDAKAPWTINLFVYTDKQPDELTLIGGFGNGRDDSGAERYLINYSGGIEFWGSNIDIASGVPLDLDKWQMLSATFDGETVRVYKNAQEIKNAPAEFNNAVDTVKLGGRGPWDNSGRFSGKIAGVTIWDESLSPAALQALLTNTPK